nr:MAG TPA: hypothetical protein [Caudoviricetes sp.]
MIGPFFLHKKYPAFQQGIFQFLLFWNPQAEFTSAEDRNRSFKTKCRWNFLFPPLSPTLRLEGKA